MDGSQRKSSLFRAVNDRIREISSGWDVPAAAGFVCECDDPSCNAVLNLTVSEYDALRGERDCFVVLPGHQSCDRDVVARADIHFAPTRFAGPPGLATT